MIRFSCADYSWPALTHHTVMSVVSDLGFTGLDVAVFGDNTYVTVTDMLTAPEKRADAVRAAAGERGLAIADVFLTGHYYDAARLNPTSRHGDDVQKLRTIYEGTARFAQAAGSAGITLLPGIVEEGRTRDEAFALAAESLSSFVDIAGERGLAVSVEPHLGSLIPEPDDILHLLGLVPGLTLTLDPAHLVFPGGTVEQMVPLVPATRHLQARFGGVGVMQGRRADNTIDYGTLVRALMENGYGGWLASEFVWMAKWDCDRVDNTAESAAMLAYLSEIVQQGQETL